MGQRAIIELTFTAENQGEHVPLDSILIENLTQSVDTTLYATDTVLVLTFQYVGISDNEFDSKNIFTVSQNYPNPVTDQASINVYMPEKDEIEITVQDLLGKEVCYYNKTLTQGNHKFIFYPGNEKVYLFNVKGKFASETIKIINANSNLGKTSQCKVVLSASDETKVTFKEQQATNNFNFYPGDELRYIGFAETIIEASGSDFIEDTPEVNGLYEFNINEGIPCPGIPYINYEGQVYNTVLIGTQCWLKENLNIGNMISGIQDMSDNDTIEKYCYDDNAFRCQVYGGLYQWGEIMKYDTTEGNKGICPMGWHIPTDEEWMQLEGEVDTKYGYPDPIWTTLGYRGQDVGLRLKSQNGWNYGGIGVDFFGFTALSTGCRLVITGEFVNMGNYTSLWSSTYAWNGGWYRFMEHGYQQVSRTANNGEMGRSVRCLKNE